MDRSKVRSGKLALHDIIDDGKRSVGFEHPAGFCFQMGDGVPHPSSGTVMVTWK